MAESVFDLVHGLKVGDALLKRVVLAAPGVADLLECGEQSERAVVTEQGPALAGSPVVMGMLLLCRQIKSIGGEAVPFTPELLKKLEPVDFLLLQAEAALLDKSVASAMEVLVNRGRDDDDGAPD